MCTSGHAVEASAALQASIARMRKGEHQVLVVGMGHGTCTCEGAAFEYAFNVEHEVRQAGVRDLADIVYLTNEYDLGDFGVGGLTFTQQGFQTTLEAVDRVALPGAWDPGHHRRPRRRASRKASSTTSSSTGRSVQLSFDFAMLLPPFRGVDLQAFDARGVGHQRASCSPRAGS